MLLPVLWLTLLPCSGGVAVTVATAGLRTPSTTTEARDSTEAVRESRVSMTPPRNSFIKPLQLSSATRLTFNFSIVFLPLSILASTVPMEMNKAFLSTLACLLAKLASSSALLLEAGEGGGNLPDVERE